MPAPLEMKRRVRLPESLGPEDFPSQRKLRRAPFVVLAWTAVVLLLVAISEGLLPIERWLGT
jgi:hypothetical protein